MGVLAHVSGWRFHRRLKGRLPPAGGIQCGVVLNPTAVAVSAAVTTVIVIIVGIVVFPNGWRRRGVAGHGVAGVGTVFKRNLSQWKLAVLVEFLKL